MGKHNVEIQHIFNDNTGKEPPIGTTISKLLSQWESQQPFPFIYTILQSTDTFKFDPSLSQSVPTHEVVDEEADSCA